MSGRGCPIFKDWQCFWRERNECAGKVCHHSNVFFHVDWRKAMILPLFGHISFNFGDFYVSRSRYEWRVTGFATYLWGLVFPNPAPLFPLGKGESCGGRDCSSLKAEAGGHQRSKTLDVLAAKGASPRYRLCISTAVVAHLDGRFWC